MTKSSMRGIFLSIVLISSIAMLITIPETVFADEVEVTSIALEETTIIEVTNNSNEDVNTIRIWLGADTTFKSFKTENGWVGEKTPQGVIIFTSSDVIKPGDSVKFGVKTDKVKPGINWKALDDKDKQMKTGKVLPKDLPIVTKNPETPSQQNVEDNQTPDIQEAMTSDSTFRIIPKEPNVGSSIRVTGDQFGASQNFDFYIDSEKIGSFVTDENGHFMTTMQIPDDQKAERVDFMIKNEEGDEKKISLRIGEPNDRIAESDNIKLTIQGIPNVIHRGDFLEIFGTGQPGGAITGEITNPDGEIINARTAEINSKGDWELEPIIIPLDTPFGKYSATITDGREDKVKQWSVESDKVILITPTKLKYDAGEIMTFNGTALKNTQVEFIVEDPLGKEIYSDIIETDDSGFVQFDFPTTQTTLEGTYTVIASQGSDKEFIFAGVGQLPSIPVNLEFDQLNYKAGDIAEIALTGKASEIISLLVINPSDNPIGDAESITLQPDGRGTYFLDLEGYASGVYTAVISKGSAQSTEIFTVGLQTGSGEIEVNTTKIDYIPGDSILILGDANPNVLLTITLTDSDGNDVKIKETFSDKNGKISESSFRIPSEATPGMWNINVKSGSNFANIEIDVLAVSTEGMIISTSEGLEVPGIGETINIDILGAAQTVSIEIIAEDGEIIDELEFPASAQGEIHQPWIIPKDTEPGTYTIKAEDAFNSAETTFVVE
ncbi:biofilm-associated protein [Nitrosopumilus sp.]|uniref:biofilm-associated protein n=1 Tax=Nitrosopumilus sp. TaxID=2024843 RepID=UPI0026311B6F|nr:biofilm-associated protein [Nitrosopumilus sp.]